MFCQVDAGTPAAQAQVDAMDAFWEAIKAILPSDVSIAIDNSLADIESTDGTITGYESVVPAAAHVGTSGTPYSGATGAVIEWLTPGVVNSRVVRGRTFLVPLALGAFDNAGSLSSSTLTTLKDAATTMAGAMTGLSVWHRPTTKAAADGDAWAVSAIRVPDLAAVLRSRRD